MLLRLFLEKNNFINGFLSVIRQIKNQIKTLYQSVAKTGKKEQHNKVNKVSMVKCL